MSTLTSADRKDQLKAAAEQYKSYVASGREAPRSLRLAAMQYELWLREERERQSDLGEPGRLGGFIHFIRYFWHILEPTTPLVEGWVLYGICAHLEAVTRGEIRRLLINVPPGFMKSLCTNVFWPLWEWSAAGRPSERYVTFSYGAHLTLRDNAKFRDLSICADFAELWGEAFQLKKAGEVKPENNHTGWKFASSVGGIGTGERGSRVLCLPGSEKILTDNGWLPIRDVVEHRLPVKIAGLDHATDTITWQAIEAYERNPGNEIVEIACEDGALRCTGDHPVFVQGRGYARADSIQSGDALVWSGRSLSVPSLQGGDQTQAKPQTQILQSPMPHRRGESDLASGQQSPMHNVWDPGVPASISLEENTRALLPRQDARKTQVTSALETRTVRSVKSVRREDVVYNVRVAPCHNYFASGFLVHNCDDLHSVRYAESEAVRTETVRWVREGMSNRLNDMIHDVIIGIGQRVHEEDASNAMMEDGDYVHFMVPMEYDPSRHCATSIGWEDPRTELGELAWPERFPAEIVAKLKRTLGPYAYSSQYQQSPEPRGGGILKRDWWEPYELAVGAPFRHNFDFIVASLDPAFTAKQENDPSGFTVWGVYTENGNPKAVLLHAWKKWLELHGQTMERLPNEDNRTYQRRASPSWGLVEWVAHDCTRLRVHRLLIEDKASGHSVAQEMRRLYNDREWGVQLINPGNLDKRARAYAIQHLFADAMIQAPASVDGDLLVFREWAQMVIDECAKFRGLPGDEDNLVDSATQAIKFLRDTGLLLRSDERKAIEIKRATHRGGARQPIYPV